MSKPTTKDLHYLYEEGSIELLAGYETKKHLAGTPTDHDQSTHGRRGAAGGGSSLDQVKARAASVRKQLTDSHIDAGREIKLRNALFSIQADRGQLKLDLNAAGMKQDFALSAFDHAAVEKWTNKKIALRYEIAKADLEVKKAQQALDEYMAGKNEFAWKTLEQPAESRGKVEADFDKSLIAYDIAGRSYRFSDDWIEGKNHEEIFRAVNFVERMTHKDALPDPDLIGLVFREAGGLSSAGSAHYVPENTDGREEPGIYITKSVMSGPNVASTTAHELGHWLSENPRNKNAALEFMDRRTKPSGARRSAWEDGTSTMLRTDGGKWIDRYAGTLYEFDDGERFTELISVGIEFFFKDPVAFARIDPAHFDLIYSMLAGGDIIT